MSDILNNAIKELGGKSARILTPDEVVEAKGLDPTIGGQLTSFANAGLKNLASYGASATKAVGLDGATDYLNDVRRSADKRITNNMSGMVGEIALDPINLLPAGIFGAVGKGATKAVSAAEKAKDYDKIRRVLRLDKLGRVAKSTGSGVVLGATTSVAKDYGNQDITAKQMEDNALFSGGVWGGINGIITAVTKGKLKNVIDTTPADRENIATNIVKNAEAFGLRPQEAQDVALKLIEYKPQTIKPEPQSVVQNIYIPQNERSAVRSLIDYKPQSAINPTPTIIKEPLDTPDKIINALRTGRVPIKTTVAPVEAPVSAPIKRVQETDLLTDKGAFDIKRLNDNEMVYRDGQVWFKQDGNLYNNMDERPDLFEEKPYYAKVEALQKIMDLQTGGDQAGHKMLDENRIIEERKKAGTKVASSPTIGGSIAGSLYGVEDTNGDGIPDSYNTEDGIKGALVGGAGTGIASKLFWDSTSVATETKNRIVDFVKRSVEKKDNTLESMDISKPSGRFVDFVKNTFGFDISGYTRKLDNYSVKHILKQHGDAAAEAMRGQIAVTPDDIAMYDDITSSPDMMAISGQTKQGRETIAYLKKYQDKLYVVEEIRTGKNVLVPVTMWKTKAATPDATGYDWKPVPRSNAQDVLPPSDTIIGKNSLDKNKINSSPVVGGSLVGGAGGSQTDLNEDGRIDEQDILLGTAMGALGGRAVRQISKGHVPEAGLGIKDVSKNVSERLDDFKSSQLVDSFKRNFTNTKLTDEYLTARDEASTAFTKKTFEVERLYNALKEFDDASREEIHNYLTGDSKEVVKELKPLADNIRNTVDSLGDDLVKSKVIPQETWDEWKGVYLHRDYAKYASKMFASINGGSATLTGVKTRGKVFKANTSAKAKEAFNDLLQAQGKQPVEFKGRNVEDVISEAKRMGLVGSAKDGKISILEARNGTYSLRREWTKAERLDKGEITDAAQSVPETLLRMNKLQEHAKLLEAISGMDNYVSTKPVDGFVQLPSDAKWGALAGKYVSKDIKGDLQRMTDELNKTLFNHDNPAARLWLDYLRVWKKSKTVFNATAHLNNVVSNLFIMHLFGTPSYKILGGMKQAVGAIAKGREYEALMAKQMAGVLDDAALKRLSALDADSSVALFKEARDLGLFGRSQLQDVMRGELSGYGDSTLNKVGRKVEQLYQDEDVFGRMIMYKYLRESQGMGSKEARDAVINIMPDYSKPLPPAIRFMRDTGISPFVSWSYYVIPKIMQQMGTRTGAKQMAKVIGTLGALEYVLTGCEIGVWDNLPGMDTNKPEDFKARNIAIGKDGNEINTMKIDRIVPYFQFLDPQNFVNDLLGSGVSTSMGLNAIEAISPNMELRDPYFGTPVTYPTKTAGQKLYDRTKYITQKYIPLPQQGYEVWNTLESMARDRSKRKISDVNKPRNTLQQLFKLGGVNTRSYDLYNLKREQQKK